MILTEVWGSRSTVLAIDCGCLSFNAHPLKTLHYF